MGNKNISGKTRLCGVIGDPIEHTMSPLMHNAALEELGLDYVYVPLKVKKEALAEAIEGMRALNMRGLNVTIPHKVAVVSLMDKLDPLAEKIWAVNTIVNDNGTLRGYNTDASGFLKTLLENGIEPKGRKAVILGAGGAARAASFALAESGATLQILNRTPDKAKALSDNISRFFRKEVEALPLDKDGLKQALLGADIVVNTTSIGMTPAIKDTPVPVTMLKPRMVVYDIVYNPVKTRFLEEAEAAGAKIISGLDMLAWQGALAFELWTGHKAPVDLMKQELMKALQK